MALATRSAAAAVSPSLAEPGWKHTWPIPSVVLRSISLARPAAARAHLSGSAVATLSTYAAWTTTCSGLIPVSSSAAWKRSTRRGLIPLLSP